MPSDLFTPIVNNRTRSVNFFNGRLLTGEDLTSEQKANKVAHSLLGQAIGSGVAYGLEVAESVTLSQVATPVLTVKKGLAINPNGGTLLLDNDTDISLVRPATTTTGGTSTFSECLPMQSGVYIAGAGVYLLTVGPASATQGLAEVSGLGTDTAPCNSKYKADGVQFRLVQIDLTQNELSDVNHLRNLVAYKCFGSADWAENVTDPFGTPPAGHGLIDQLRLSQIITGCEVPLAMLYWTATDGVVFVDMWSVRRRLTRWSANDEFSALSADQAQSVGQAMLLQFQDQLGTILTQNAAPQNIRASDFFYFLPPLGFLPLAGSSAGAGFNYQQFFAQQTTHTPVFVADSRVQWMLNSFGAFQPIDLSSKELIWLYLVPTNAKTSNQTGTGVLPYALFAAGNVPYQGDSRFNLSHWNFSNYSLTAGDFITL